jgi:FkbM family methyltransferase
MGEHFGIVMKSPMDLVLDYSILGRSAMFARQTMIQRKLRSLALRLFYAVENNGDADFETNGERVFFNNLFALLTSNTAGDLILFDVGANVGKYSQMILDKSKMSNVNIRLHLFEPTSSSFEVIKEKFSGINQIILNRKAVSEIDGEAEIFFDRACSRWASLYKRNLSAFSVEMKRSEVVETIRLESYIERNGIKHINFIKLDIEGHEIAALKGVGRYLDHSFIDFIQFEYGGANLDSHTNLMELFALFESAGFVVAKVMPKGLDPRTYQPWMDNFQYANYVAISKNVTHKIM